MATTSVAIKWKKSSLQTCEHVRTPGLECKNISICFCINKELWSKRGCSVRTTWDTHNKHVGERRQAMVVSLDTLFNEHHPFLSFVLLFIFFFSVETIWSLLAVTMLTLYAANTLTNLSATWSRKKGFTTQSPEEKGKKKKSTGLFLGVEERNTNTT